MNTAFPRLSFSTFTASTALLLALASTPGRARGADRTWSGAGGDNNWSTPANWGGTAPAAGDSLFFGGNVRTTPNNNFLSGTLFNGLTINNPAGPFTLGGNSITLGGTLTDNMPLVPQTISFPVALNGSHTISVVNDGLLTLGGVLSGSGFGLSKNGGGLLTLSGANTFSGSVAIQAGTLSVAADNNLGLVPAGPTPGRIKIDGGALRTTATFTLAANRGVALGPIVGSGAGTFTVNSGTTLTYGGIIANNGGGSGGLTKNAFGGLTLSAANTFSGPTVIQNGTVTLDFTQAASPANNVISSSSALTLGGANAGLGAASFDALILNGRGGGASSQSFNGTTIDIGPAIIRANSGAGGSANMALGALGHAPGGILNLIPPTANGGAGSITTTTPNTHGILGGWATVGNGGAFNSITMGTDFASMDGGNIVPYTGYAVYQTGQTLHNSVTAGTNLRINGISTGDVTVDAPAAGTLTDLNTINLSETRAMSIVIGDGNTLRLGQFGSIFKSDNANNLTWALGSGTTGGANGVQDAGSLTAGGAPDTPGEIVFYMNNGSSQSQGSLNVEARVTDNGSGAVTLVKAGPASMKLRGHNTHSGGLVLLQGRLQFAGSEIGTGNPDAGGSGRIYVMPGAYLFLSGIGDFGATGVGISNALSIAGLGTQQEQVGAVRFGNGSRVVGDVTLTGDARIGGGNAATLPNTGISGRISGPYNLDIGALGTINTHLSLFHPGNDWSGTTTLNARNTATANNFRNGASDVIPHGVGKGNVVMNGNTSTGTITWDLNGFNETINGLLSTGYLAGCLIVNNLAATASTLTVGDYDQTATFGGAIQNGAGTVQLNKIGGGRQTLTASNSYSGPTTITGGTLALTGAGSIASSSQINVNGGALDVSEVAGGFTYTSLLDVSNGGALSVRSTVAPGLAALNLADGRVRLTSLGATAVAIEATSLTTGGSSNLIDIASVGTISSYPAQFTIIKYGGAIGGAGFNFSLGNVPTPSTVGFISNNVDNSSIDLVLLDGPKPLTWTSAQGPAWDVATTTNWLAFGVTPTAFLDVDSVLFNDSASASTVNLTTNLQPGAILVNNSALTYTFTGIGKLSGPAELTKEGNGILILNNSAVNEFFGTIAINAGTVQVGNNDANGSLGVGPVVNNASLTFSRSDAHTAANVISGPGTVTHNGSGTLTLSGNSTFTGPVVASQGVLKPGSSGAFGAVDGATVVNNGATLDVNGQNLGAEPVTVSGTGVGNAGAIVNSGGAQLNALRFVTLAGDTTFGGIDRWDIRGAGGAGSLTCGGLTTLITKVGPNQVSLVGLAEVDGAVADIDVREGIFSVQTTTAQLGDPFALLTVRPGATLSLFNLNPNPLNKLILLMDRSTLWNENGSSLVSGSISVEGTATINASAGGTSPMLSLNGVIGGAGNLVKIGSGAVTLNGTHTYTGTTTISNGTVFVDGSHTGGGAVTVRGGTLGGVGALSGPVTIAAGGTLAPGNLTSPFSILQMDNNLILEGTNAMDVAKTGGVIGGDLIIFIADLSYGGTLQLNLSGEPLAAGDVLNLYAFNSASGSFARIIPATPGPGLVWDTSGLVGAGALRVAEVARPGIADISIADGNVVLTGTNGSPGGISYVVSSTNVVLPIADWVRVGTNVFDSNGSFSFTNAVNPNTPQQFFRLQLP